MYAFEPNPWAYKVLHENSKGTTITALNSGISNANGYRNLLLHVDHSDNPLLTSTASSLEEKKWNVDKNNSVQVEVRSLVDFIRSLNADIDILKIDIEGHEIEVLTDVIKHPDVWRKIKLCLVETHEQKYSALKEETQNLKDFFKRYKPFRCSFDWH